MDELREVNKKVIFLVGLGSPASLYEDYFDDLKKNLPKIKLFVCEWWNQEDFGINSLQSYIDGSEVILIAHSAGGVIALEALAKWPSFVKKIILLDSHFLRTMNTLPTVNHMLDIMLRNDDSVIKDRVKNAYAPIIDNSVVFNKALKFAIDWVNSRFHQVSSKINAMPAHSVLFIGFSNSGYQILNPEDEKALLITWKKFNVAPKFLPMNHFDLIDTKYATQINQLLSKWLIKPNYHQKNT